MPNRRVEKYQPAQIKVDETREKVEKLEWIRRNTEQLQNKKMKIMDEQDANNLGVGVEEQEPRRKYDLDREEEELVRHEVREKVKIIKSEHKKHIQTS